MLHKSIEYTPYEYMQILGNIELLLDKNRLLSENTEVEITSPYKYKFIRQHHGKKKKLRKITLQLTLR